MNKTNVEEFVEKLRMTFPQLKLELIVDDIELSVRDMGIDVKFAEMKSLEKKGSKVFGYTSVSQDSGRPYIVLSGNDTTQERRLTLAHQLGEIFISWNWMPGKNLDMNLKGMRVQSEKIVQTKRMEQLNEFMLELLVPIDIVGQVVEAFEKLPLHMKIRISLIGNTLSNTLKVPTYMAMTQLEKYYNRIDEQ